MPLPIMTFACGACGRVESIQLGALQLVGAQPWLCAYGWRAHRARPHTVRCEACWSAQPLSPPEDVDVVRAFLPGDDLDLDEDAPS